MRSAIISQQNDVLLEARNPGTEQSRRVRTALWECACYSMVLEQHLLRALFNISFSKVSIRS